MTQTAKVIKTDGEYAIVNVSRNAMCDGCHNSGSACSQCMSFGSKDAECRVLNRIGARIGDTVTVYTRTSYFLMQCALLYVLPIIIAAIAYSLTASTQYAILVAILSFVLSFAIAAFALNNASEKTILNEITEIKKTEGNSPTDA